MDTYEDALAAFRAGDNDRARRLSDAITTSARASGDVAAEVNGLCMLSRVALREGRLDEVKSYAQAAHGVATAAVQPRLTRMPLHATGRRIPLPAFLAR